MKPPNCGFQVKQAAGRETLACYLRSVVNDVDLISDGSHTAFAIARDVVGTL